MPLSSLQWSFSNLSSVQVFNVEQYMRYPDLKAAFGENIDLLLNHYLNYGQFENRTDGIMDVSDLNNVIAQSNILTGSTSTQIKITQSSTINGGDEAEFLTLLTNESRGQINLIDNQIEVDSGTISLATYGLLDATTTGQIYAIPRPSGDGRAEPLNLTPPTLSTDAEALAYIASHQDLIEAFSTNLDSAKSHFEDYGKPEGRTITFDVTQYLSNYDDLRSAFESDTEAAIRHYITNGYSEGRTYLETPDTIDAFDMTTTPDIVETTDATVAESIDIIYEPLSDIEALNYLASHSDLAKAFGTDIEAAKSHYEVHGYSEGRIVDNFDELGYIASHADLMSAFGADSNNLEVNGLTHYITNGIYENRSTIFDVTSYIDNNNLIDQFSNDLNSAKRYYISSFIADL